MPLGQWIGWTLLFALVYWGVQVAQALLEERLRGGGPNDIVQVVGLLIPLMAAFLIGARLRSWWWIFGPPLAIILLMLTYPLYSYLMMPQASRQQAGAGLVLAIAVILIAAGVALLAAAAGVWFGKARL